MRYRLLGRSGLRVSELCLGTMTFGEEWGWGADQAESRRIFERFAEAGGTFIDTANYYTDGTSERWLGEMLGRDRERFVIATKYTLSMDRADPNAGGNHRRNMVRSLEASLRRLDCDAIDLFWLHMWDYTTAVDEVMRALDDLVRAGKILHVGLSDTPAWIVSRANTLAELRGWTPAVAVQVPYSVARRDAERDILPMAGGLGLTVTAWGLLGGGALTGKFSGKDPDARRQSREDVAEPTLRLGEEVTRIAGEIGRTPAQVAINWVRQRPGPAAVLPILGARTERQLEDNLGCLEFDLDPAHVTRLDASSGFVAGFPNDFLGSDNVRRLIFGDLAEDGRLELPGPPGPR